MAERAPLANPDAEAFAEHPSPADESSSRSEAVEASAWTVRVPSVGSFTGPSDGVVAQFKNVPFGVIPARFEPAELAANVGDRQCFEQGPLCPQGPPYSDSTLGVPTEAVRQFKIDFDEFACLNLMITAPDLRTIPLSTPTLESDNGIPVVVWIHGGSNLAGTAYRGVNDPHAWVERSVRTGKPLIVVTLQFRVGLLGFLPVKGRGNFSLMDQQLGIEWVYRHIVHWGGDPTRMTLFGQSSGAFCAHVQASVANPRFRGAALLSGSLRGIGAHSLDEYAALSSRVCEYLGVADAEALRTRPWEDLVKAQEHLGIVVIHPVDDGHFLPKGTYLKAPTAMERVMVSDCREDGFFFADGLPEGQLAAVVRDAFAGEAKAEPQATVTEVDRDRTSTAVLAAYNGVATDRDAVELLTDYIFGVGCDTVDTELRAAGSQVFRQFFDATNPLTPSFGNNHMVELFYTLQGYELPAATRALGQQIQDAWTQFAYFEDAWDPKSAALWVRDTAESLPLSEAAAARRVRNYALLRAGAPQRAIRRLITGW